MQDDSEDNRMFNKTPIKAQQRSVTGVASVFRFLFSLSIGFAIFVGIPALFTAIAPVSWIKFDRSAGQTRATTKTCLLFLIPYQSRTIESIDRISTRFVAGEYNEDSRRSGKDQTKSEDQGFLVIHSKDQTVEVSVSPVSLGTVSRQAQDFLDSSNEGPLELFVVANWKFSVIAGGLLCLLTVFYLVALSCDLVLKLIHGIQWTIGIPPEKRLLAAWVKKANQRQP